MAAFTSYRTGNWSDDAANATSPWNGGGQSGVPGSGDTVTIAAGHTITVDTNTTSGGGVVGSGAGTATLVIGTGVTFTLSGALQIGGNSDGVRGAFTFGAGSTLALGANLTIANAIIRSSATTASWATVTGSGSFGHDAGLAGSPRMDIVLSYVSFQNTGVVGFPCGTTRGTGLTTQIDVQHCAFVGCATCFFGGASEATPLDIRHVVDYCDFRDLTDVNRAIRIRGASGDATGVYSFSHNTCSASAARSIQVAAKDNLVATGNVLFNFRWGDAINAGWSAGGVVLSDSFLAVDASISPGNLITASGAEDPNSVEDCYIYAPWANSHPFAFSGTGGTGTEQIIRNVIESPFNTDDPDAYVAAQMSKNVALTYNLLIGSGSLLSFVGPKTGGSLTLEHNTAYINDASHLDYPALLLGKTGTYTGGITIRSNLVSGVGTLTYGCYNLDIAPAQPITADYNCFDDVTTAYSDFDVTGATHDITASPSFVASTRNLANWDQAEGSGNGLESAAIAYLLALNGYSEIGKTQSETPTTKGPSDLVTWVRNGFKVQAAALNNAGHDGATIGAMGYQKKRRRRLGLLMPI